ncbi:hypothetical protein ACHAXT_003672 [Thalassiosira profunda]
MPFLGLRAASGGGAAVAVPVGSSDVAPAQPVAEGTVHPQPSTNAQPSTPNANNAPYATANQHLANADDDRRLSPDQFTRVDGRGLWRSWTRNFKTKLLALLDLIDNSLDASIETEDTSSGGDEDNNGEGSFVGRVHIYPDVSPTPDAVSSNLMSDDTANSNNGNTGLCIVNNSVKPIRPLVRVLEVYNSSKVHSGSGDIGENGVGLKQGCATLSNLSFVLAKNAEEGFVELGLIAEALQRVEGCYLPAFRFELSEEEDEGAVLVNLREQMFNLFTQPKHLNVAKCIAQYGSAARGSQSDLDKGIDRLVAHFRGILDFYGSKHVFAVVLDDVHGDVARTTDPIQELRAAIPKTYLHVPDNFDFRIGSSPALREKITFQYWPQRLVELTSFMVNIHETLPWHEHMAWTGSDTYQMRVFVGFDRMRINNPDEGKAASLYIYSRQSGRLIKHEPDARFHLGLTSGGTDYCQALTVLIDDIGGKLPLNPTKQDVAFGEQANGAVHEENLFAYVGAVAKFNWDWNYAKYDKKKTRLTARVKEFGNQLVEAPMRVIDRCQLTTFSYDYKYRKRDWVRVNMASAIEMPGPDTHFHLIADPPPPPLSPPPPIYGPPSDNNGGTLDSNGRRTRRRIDGPGEEAGQQLQRLQPMAGFPGKVWQCDRCQQINLPIRARCRICGATAPQMDPEVDIEAALGASIFEPAAQNDGASRRSGGTQNGYAPAGASDDDDDQSDTSTKEYYVDLCNKLTVKLEKRTEKNDQLKGKVKELKGEVERLTQLLSQQSLGEQSIPFLR